MGGRILRAYQREPALAIARAARQGEGGVFVVMFPRQSGKNELQAQLEAYLLYLLREQDAELVKISPTWKPQSLNAMRRLERVLSRHPLTGQMWAKESGYIYRVGRARILFLSGAPESNIVGATATHLLEVDEAQDVSIAKYDRDVAPMAASTNAARVFWGTTWTAHTLLARELRAAREAERKSGGAQKRAFVLTADEVAREVPAYGAFVAGQVERLGRDHPMIRTQYYSEELDGQAGMFPAERLALMRSTGPARRENPAGGRLYAMLLDVAGEDEAGGLDPAALENPRRDATALTVVEVDRSTVGDPLLRAPVYRVVERRAWVGVRHARLYGEIRALAAAAPPPGSFLVVDESENWEVLNPQLESQDAGEDGLALKKMIAAGAGLPLHFLAEPEGSNKTTAESAGGPTYRHFEQRQEFFTWLVGDLARVVLRRRAMVDRRIKAESQVQVTGADLSARDNAALGVAMSTVISALATLRDRCVIDDAELLRMAYRFAGEVVDVESLLERGRKAGPRLTSDPEGYGKKDGGGGGMPQVPGKPAGVKVDPDSGEERGLPRVE